MKKSFLVFVHGYSVTNFDTYGELPNRLKNEAASLGWDIIIEHIFLGRYISFNDEVRLDDVSRAFEFAIHEQVLPVTGGKRFICITHSTGGPVLRNWHRMFYLHSKCPVSHLIMLAPANFGSSLAQLGKSKLSRIKSWFDKVEPGQKILDWLELGSREAWELNRAWITEGNKYVNSEDGFFPFVVTGQSIDHKLYDHLNSYTGEIGSDGVIRVASANLNTRFIRLVQNANALSELIVSEYQEAVETAFRVVTDKSHSGREMGIMGSVKLEVDDISSKETIEVILRCIRVSNKLDYDNLCKDFIQQTETAQQRGLVEVENKILQNKFFIHDRHSMVIFKLIDDAGQAIRDFDLILTAGTNHDPNALPTGFFADRQCNKRDNNHLTYYFNYNVMKGGVPAIYHNNKLLRGSLEGTKGLGLRIIPRPDEGFVRYEACDVYASDDLFNKVLKPNSTTLIEIVLHRLVSSETFRFKAFDGTELSEGSFKDTDPGGKVIP